MQSSCSLPLVKAKVYGELTQNQNFADGVRGAYLKANVQHKDLTRLFRKLVNTTFPHENEALREQMARYLSKKNPNRLFGIGEHSEKNQESKYEHWQMLKQVVLQTTRELKEIKELTSSVETKLSLIALWNVPPGVFEMQVADLDEERYPVKKCEEKKDYYPAPVTAPAPRLDSPSRYVAAAAPAAAQAAAAAAAPAAAASWNYGAAAAAAPAAAQAAPAAAPWNYGAAAAAPAAAQAAAAPAAASWNYGAAAAAAPAAAQAAHPAAAQNAAAAVPAAAQGAAQGAYHGYVQNAAAAAPAGAVIAVPVAAVAPVAAVVALAATSHDEI